MALTFPDKSQAEIDTSSSRYGTISAVPSASSPIAAERLEIVGGELIAAMRDDGRPGILIGAHFGGWELSGPLAARMPMLPAGS